MAKDLKQLEARKAELEKLIEPYNAQIKEIENECKQLTKQNADKIEKRKKLRNKKDNYRNGIIATIIICAIAAYILWFYFDMPLITYIIDGCVAVALSILFFKQWSRAKTEYEKSNSDLAEYDGEIKKREDKIYNIKYTTSGDYRSELSDIEDEIRIFKFNESHKNTVIVRVVLKELNGSKVSPLSTNIHQANVFIDGIEVGMVTAPYSTFIVNPGIHSLKISYSRLNSPCAETSATQIVANDDCNLIYCEMNLAGSSSLSYKINKYNDPIDFYSDTHTSVN